MNTKFSTIRKPGITHVTGFISVRPRSERNHGTDLPAPGSATWTSPV